MVLVILDIILDKFLYCCITKHSNTLDKIGRLDIGLKSVVDVRIFTYRIDQILSAIH